MTDERPHNLPPVAAAGAGRRGRWVRWIEQIFVFYGIIVINGSLIYLLRRSSGESDFAIAQSDSASTLLEALLLLGVAMGLWLRRERLRPVLRSLTPFVALLLLCAASALWSPYPGLTARRTVNLALTLAFGLYCWTALDLKGFIAALARATLVLAVASMVAYVVAPAIGRDTALGYEGAMRGVFPQKNVMALNLALGSSCYLYLWLAATRRRWRAIAAMAVILAAIILSRSATGVGVCLVAALMAVLMRAWPEPRRRLVAAYAVLCVFAAVVVALVVAPDVVFDIVGRDASMTGRLPLWGMTLDPILDHPLLGFGYGGFWNPDSREAQYIWTSITWPAPDAHNGYLDLLLQLGFAGAAVYFWIWIPILTGTRVALRAGSLPEARWILVLIVITILYNLDEGTLPGTDLYGAATPICVAALVAWRRQRVRSVAAPLTAGRADAAAFRRPAMSLMAPRAPRDLS